MNRKTGLTPEVHAKIVEALRGGNYRKIAASFAGINEDTLLLWLKRGATGEEPFAALAKDVEAAERDSESEMVKIITDNSRDDWRAAAWILARKHPGRWGQTQKTEITGKDGGPVAVDVKSMSDDEIERRIAELSSRT